MILHLLKLVWHRKRAHVLVAAEICCSFLIVFFVATLGASLVSRWRAPLGFDWRDVWAIEVDRGLPRENSSSSTRGPTAADVVKSAGRADRIDHLLRDLRLMPQIESAAADSMTPYGDMLWGSVINVNGRRVDVSADQATDDFARVMRLKILRGRWFNADDEAASYLPVVIDASAARAMFGAIDAVGQRIPGDGRTGTAEGEMRVVGVIAPFRQEGEFSANDTNFVFFRASTTRPVPPDANRILVRVRAGTPGSFEGELDQRLHRLNPDSRFRIRRMSDMRQGAIRMRMVPIVALGTVAVFLISMVMLGLTGVLWQTVTRRMREIGLRRALGAPASAVRVQVLAEVALLATLAVVVGALVVIQLPLLGVFRIVTRGEFAAGLAASMVVIYAITLACGAYPSWLASRVDPAEALRYE